MRALLLALCLVGPYWGCVSAPKPWASLEYQHDSRDFQRLSLDGQAPLPGGFGVWGFVDLDSRQSGETETYFVRTQVFRELWNGIGVAVEGQDATGVGSEGKVGATFTLPLLPESTFVQVIGFSVHDGEDQIRVVAAQDLPLGFSAGGFWDFLDDSRQVGEVQLRWSYLFAEYKHNDYLGNEDGVGLGVRFTW